MFSEKSSVSWLMRHRPAVIEILEASAQPFWNYAEMSVEHFCRMAGMDSHKLLHMAENSPIVPANSNWKEARLYSIVDFLIADHRRFREKDLPIFSEKLEKCAVENSDACGIKFAKEAFKSFKSAFLNHLDEEEENVFPYLLQLEGIYSFTGDRKSRASRKKSSNSLEHLNRAYEQHLDRLALDAGLLFNEEMNDFRRRLIRHSKIETEVLFPRARQLEAKPAGRRRAYSSI